MNMTSAHLLVSRNSRMTISVCSMPTPRCLEPCRLPSVALHSSAQITCCLEPTWPLIPKKVRASSGKPFGSSTTSRHLSTTKRKSTRKMHANYCGLIKLHPPLISVRQGRGNFFWVRSPLVGEGQGEGYVNLFISVTVEAGGETCRLKIDMIKAWPCVSLF